MARKTAFYNDQKFDYRKYWKNREYEHLAEENIVRRIIRHIKPQDSIADVGGGFGRLAPLYAPFFKKCYLIEPSEKMIQQTKGLLKIFPNLQAIKAFAEDIPLRDEEVQALLCIRTIHHLESPDLAIREFKRVLQKKGYLIVEFANKMHFKNVVKAIFRKDKNFFEIPTEDISHKKNSCPFVNYSPKYIMDILKRHNFEIIRTYSVSNFRHPTLKNIIPLPVILAADKFFSLISYFIFPLRFFGPSIFVFCKKR